MERWAAEALRRALDKVAAQRNLSGYPHIVDHGQWVLTRDGAWTGGFWIGLLWALYEEDGDTTVREQAERLLQGFLTRAGERTNHDLGFMFCPSAVAGWRITGAERYRSGAIEAAVDPAAPVPPERTRDVAPVGETVRADHLRHHEFQRIEPRLVRRLGRRSQGLLDHLPQLARRWRT